MNKKKKIKKLEKRIEELNNRVDALDNRLSEFTEAIEKLKNITDAFSNTIESPKWHIKNTKYSCYDKHLLDKLGDAVKSCYCESEVKI